MSPQPSVTEKDTKDVIYVEGKWQEENKISNGLEESSVCGHVEP